MKYDHGQVVRIDVQVGHEYDYTEDGAICIVKVLEDTSTPPNGPLAFKLEVLEEKHPAWHGGRLPVGTVFNVSAAEGRYAYNGMWRLWPKGEYVVLEEPD